MVFSSLVFLFAFLPSTIAIYFILPGIKLKNGWLIIVSLLFYAWGEPRFVLAMLTSIFLNYLFGLLVNRTAGLRRRLLFISALVINLGLIGVYKYLGFVVENLNSLFSADITPPAILLPLGISFFTFQALSYVIDVYRNDVPVQRNFFDLLLYISFFPQLVAGPIVRYETIQFQIGQRAYTLEKIEQGTRRFLAGLAKKVIIANQLAVVADEVFAVPAGELPILTVWLAVVAYSFQIFFDFSGYSDMAIGLGKIFGFEFDENFDFPYVAKSVGEFWRRWHISLGTWFRDYVYIPLGGSRRGRGREIFNLLIVWGLTGLWHGASWNFVAWGLYFFLLITIERLFLGRVLERHPAFGHVYLCAAALFGWVLFRASGLMAALGLYKVMLGLAGSPVWNPQTLVYINDNWYIFLAAAVLSTPVLSRLGRTLAGKIPPVFYTARALFYIASYVLVIVFLVNSSYNPFIYFRF